jgi:hypothetical protein
MHEKQNPTKAPFTFAVGMRDMADIEEFGLFACQLAVIPMLEARREATARGFVKWASPLTFNALKSIAVPVTKQTMLTSEDITTYRPVRSVLGSKYKGKSTGGVIPTGKLMYGLAQIYR